MPGRSFEIRYPNGDFEIDAGPPSAETQASIAASSSVQRPDPGAGAQYRRTPSSLPALRAMDVDNPFARPPYDRILVALVDPEALFRVGVAEHEKPSQIDGRLGSASGKDLMRL